MEKASVAGTTVFGALAVVLTVASQGLGLNFPVIPYLQFDFGEVAILLSFFIFGPIAAFVSAFIELVTLMAIGQNVPIGPFFKGLAIVSTLFGVWAGVRLVSRSRHPTVGRAGGLGTILGMALRALAMTVANYFLLIYIYGVPGTVGYLSAFFGLVGVDLTQANGLFWILAFTAIFNCAQLILVSAISFVVVRSPQVGASRVGGRPLWLDATLTGER